MDVLRSAEFRKAYAKLTQPTTVTVNGHVLGVWYPVEVTPLPDRRGWTKVRAAATTPVAAVEAARDAYREFRPAPKPRQR